MDTLTIPADEPPSAAIVRACLSLIFLFFLVACQQPSSLNEKKKGVSAKTIAPRTTERPDSATAEEEQEEAQAPAKRKKKIYLTFDDGPNNGTSNVLNIIKDENIPVSFFLIGQHAFASKGQQATWDSLQAITDLIELCNHSFTHAWHNNYNKFYRSPDSVIRDFDKTREALRLSNNIARMPGRNAWRVDSLHFTDNVKSKASVDSLQKAGYTVIGWDLEWHFNPKTMNVTGTADQLVRQIDSLFARKKTKQPNNLVLLAHDQAYKSAADSLQLRQFIQMLKLKDDYEFAIVSNYPGVRKPFQTDSSKNGNKNKKPGPLTDVKN